MEVLKAALIYFLFSALLSLSAEGLRTAKRREAASKQQNKPVLMIGEKKEEPNMNKLQAEIEKLEAETDHNEVNELLLRMLYAKAEELGEDPSDEEAEEAVNQVRTELLMQILRCKQATEADNYDWDEDTRDNMVLIRSVFEDMEVRYREYVPQQGVYAFELGLTTDGKKLNMKVYLEEDPKVCRIDAVYPFQAEPEFVYPLCLKLAAENYQRRYGALQYDASDNELSYRYSFSVKHGLYEDDFRGAFLAVVASAHASYDVVKQYAVGRFRRADREEIICKAQKLIIELDQ